MSSQLLEKQTNMTRVFCPIIPYDKQYLSSDKGYSR